MICTSSKKGLLGLEILWAVLVIIILAIGLIFGFSAFSDIKDDIRSDNDMSQAAKDSVNESVGNFPDYMDNVLIFLFFMLWVFLLAAAYFSASNPVLMVFSLIVVIIGMVIFLMLANQYEQMTNDQEISTFADEFIKTNWLLEHGLLTFIFMAFSFFFVVYVRSRG